MKGYPKHLNSKADYYFVKDNFPREMWLKDWQKLIDTKKAWFMGDEVDAGKGIEDDTHRVIAMTDSKATQELIDSAKTDEEKAKIEPVVKYYQQELKVNPMCDMLTLGFTEDEVKTAIAAE